MRKVELSYILAAASGDKRIRNPLIELLGAVRAKGSIVAAAAEVGFSYRYVWGELKRWESELGQPLIVWNKGQPAQLTPFGERLLWAERMAQARLAPQLEAMHAELERAFAVAFDEHAQVQTLFASHDDAVAALREFAVEHANLHVDARFCGSIEALQALNEGRCSVAGFHARPHPGEAARQAYRSLLTPGEHKLIGFAERTQGLIVAPGNPLGLRTLGDLVPREARFVNRTLGTGTRLLVDELLEEASIPAAAIRGYANAQPSHEAVAQAVAAGDADAGLGIEAAARRHGLDFIPLEVEHYYLLCLKSALDEAPMRLLREVLQSAAWQAKVGRIPGYRPLRSGQVLSLKATLPWWNLPPKKVAKLA